MRLSHRVGTRASPEQVWSVLGRPQRWPEFDVALRRVRGATGEARTGQHLMAVVRGLPVAVPVDVVEALPTRRLVLRVASFPGMAHEVTTEVVPRLRGGCTLSVRVVTDGLLARPAALPVWALSALTTRLLASRCDRAAADQQGRLSA
ncbi:MAG: SRPBCC family protein [Mycobacteriales bacterium]|nr:SRPBCC family protein [Mycobacteriales bacterium]